MAWEPGASERKRIIHRTIRADVQESEVCPAIQIGYRTYFW